MNKNTRIIWIIVFVFGAIGLVICAARGAGSVYVQTTTKTYHQITPPPKDGQEQKPEWKSVSAEELEELIGEGYTTTGEPAEITSARSIDPKYKDHPAYKNSVSFSWTRTIGVWIGGLLTLCVLSFLWGDNPFYKSAEALVIGASAAYIMVAAFWPMLVELLFGNLMPGTVRAVFYPGLETKSTNWLYLAPLILSILLLWRLAPKGGWISRWPLAFFIGATAGFRLLSHLQSDFTEQIRAAINPLYAMNDSGFDFWKTLEALVMFVGLLAVLVYFFFSVEHKGVVGKTARFGIWFLMITFGAMFGYTVMGRIALIAQRFEFLVDDWLWIIDPTGKRVIETAGLILHSLGVA